LPDISAGKNAIHHYLRRVAIKQEYYRRVAEPYEDKKIIENGDIKEYKRLK
jgi:hypothetical protein